VNWIKLKSIFYLCAAVWLIGGIAIQIALQQRGADIYSLLNLHFIVVTGFGSVTIILGAVLLGRWIWLKYQTRRHISPHVKAQNQAPRTTSLTASHPLGGTTDAANSERWNALVRFDDEIRSAAEKLQPFGDRWVSELGKAYFALNEDRRYLRNIVDRLIREIEEEERQRWADRFQSTHKNEHCTEASLEILREAEHQGYTLAVDENRTVIATRNSTQSYLRSNNDILFFGQHLRKQA
jgi:hypothetical protein